MKLLLLSYILSNLTLQTMAMGKFFAKTIATAVAVLFAAYILKGVHVDDTVTALLVAVVLGLMNSFIKPILVILTIPITILTLGLFLLIINIIIVKWVANIVPGFTVNGWFTALIFSLVVSFVSSFIEAIIGGNRKAD
jgi:putative membrane protein